MASVSSRSHFPPPYQHVLGPPPKPPTGTLVLVSGFTQEPSLGRGVMRTFAEVDSGPRFPNGRERRDKMQQFGSGAAPGASSGRSTDALTFKGVRDRLVGQQTAHVGPCPLACKPHLWALPHRVTHLQGALPAGTGTDLCSPWM